MGECSRSRSRCWATGSTTTIPPTSRRQATSCSSSLPTSSRSTPRTTTTSWPPRRRHSASWLGGPAVTWGQSRYGRRGLPEPKEGGLYWMESGHAGEPPHPNAAYAWLNFIHEPAIQAEETVANNYATANDAAKKLVPENSSTMRLSSHPTMSSAISKAVWITPVSSSARTSGPSSSRISVPTLTRADDAQERRRDAYRGRPASAREAGPLAVGPPDHRPGPASRSVVRVLLVAPLAIVVVFSFGSRAPNGGYVPGFRLDNYSRRSNSSTHSSPAW